MNKNILMKNSLKKSKTKLKKKKSLAVIFSHLDNFDSENYDCSTGSWENADNQRPSSCDNIDNDKEEGAPVLEEEFNNDETASIADKSTPKSAWMDDEDIERSPAQFEDGQIKTPKWAECPSSGNPSVVEVKKLLSNRIKGALPPFVLNFKKANASFSKMGNISHFTFNNDAALALVSHGSNYMGSCSLFQVDGENNYFIQKINFPNFPISNALFIGMDRFIVVSQSHSHFYTYNLSTGIKKIIFIQDQKKGAEKLMKVIISPNREKIVFVTSGNKIYFYNVDAVTHISTLSLPSKAKDAVFNVSSNQLFVYCSNGFVYIYDVEKLKCVNLFYDDGSIEGMCIAISPNSKYIACGSTSGIVNLYDTSKMTSENPTPVKIFKKLLTEITSLTFNYTSEILFMSSSATSGAARMAHIHSLELFKNFPSSRDIPTPIFGAEFSPKSAYLALVKGNRIELLRLKHYRAY